jgi:hypothetical protein
VAGWTLKHSFKETFEIISMLFNVVTITTDYNLKTENKWVILSFL